MTLSALMTSTRRHNRPIVYVRDCAYLFGPFAGLTSKPGRIRVPLSLSCSVFKKLFGISPVLYPRRGCQPERSVEFLGPI